MGLDFDKSDAHWAYSGFHRFRCRLAKEAGIDLNSMEGFGGGISWDTFDDPIKPLLDHSDCDGLLTPQECKAVAPRLKELISGWADGDWDRMTAQRFADDLQKCADSNEDMVFC